MIEGGSVDLRFVLYFNDVQTDVGALTQNVRNAVQQVPADGLVRKEDSRVGQQLPLIGCDLIEGKCRLVRQRCIHFTSAASNGGGACKRQGTGTGKPHEQSLSLHQPTVVFWSVVVRKTGRSEEHTSELQSQSN